MKYELRQYQKTAINSLRDMYRSYRRQVMVSPTGSGKTVIASRIIELTREAGNKVLFLAHRRELITQCSKKLDEIGIDHGIIMSNHPRSRPSSHVQIASVQTLLNRELPPADLIIIDECHRSLAKSYVTIVDQYGNVPVLGLTATPWRGDGQGMGVFYENMYVVSQVKELIGEGFLMEPSVYITEPPRLDDVRVVGGDYVDEELEKVMNERRLNRQIVEDWLNRTPGAKTALFACTVNHSMNLVDEFRKAGVVAEHLDCNTHVDERDAILERLKSGETQIVSNVGVLTEGWDLPELECVILGRPTKSLALYLQMVGRGMRPHESKQDTYVLDHAGCTVEHGLVTDDREFNLEGSGNQYIKFPKMVIDQSEKLLADICNKCESTNITTVPKFHNEIGIKHGLAFRCRDCGWVTFLRKASSYFANDAEKLAEFKRLKNIELDLNYAEDWAEKRYYEIFRELGGFPRL